MIIELFRALVIFQPFIWIWIIEDEKSFKILNDVNMELWFSVLVFCWSILIFIYDLGIGFYTTELLILYAWMVWVTVQVLIKKFKFTFRNAIANSFLIVYLNSWYWESFLHIWVIMEKGFNMNQLVQALHLLPAIYFLMSYRFDVEMAIDQLGKGFFISAMIGMIKHFRLWQYIPLDHTYQTVYFFNHGLMIMNRLICWVFLFNTIIIWGMHKADYLNLMRQTKILYME